MSDAIATQARSRASADGHFKRCNSNLNSAHSFSFIWIAFALGRPTWVLAGQRHEVAHAPRGDLRNVYRKLLLSNKNQEFDQIRDIALRRYARSKRSSRIFHERHL